MLCHSWPWKPEPLVDKYESQSADTDALVVQDSHCTIMHVQTRTLVLFELLHRV